MAAERRERKNERQRLWVAANREKARESVRNSYWRTRQERLAYLRHYREENKKRLREYGHQYRERKRQRQEAEGAE